VAALLSATLVRNSPGYGVDERELDPRFNRESIQALRHKQSFGEGIGFYGRYMRSVLHGEFGTSEFLGRPIKELFVERYPATRDSVLLGLLAAWTISLAGALVGIVFRGWFFEAASSTVVSVLISLPAAVIALLFLYLRGPVYLAIAVVILPRLFRYIRNLIKHSYESPHVLAAQASGLTARRVFIWHVVPNVAPPLIALLGVSISMAVGASIPIEVFCDSPGLGQLAWQGALNRDLPLIVSVTFLIALLTLAANMVADLGSRALTGELR
jgi:peptide/nickel transport system permease protein